MVTEINWDNINQSLNFYKNKGYEYIEAPWIVPDHIARLTLPEDKTDISLVTCDTGTLVGSAEQSLLYLQDKCDVRLDKPGRYVSCTPCFRNEEQYDNLHLPYFMKVELYVTLHDQQKALDEVINLASELSSMLAGQEVKKIITEIGIDIELNGIEIGSYGRRSYLNRVWVYGTGIAEPRFTTACNTKRLQSLIDIRTSL